MKKSRGLRQYMIIIFTLFGIILMATIYPVVRSSVNRMEEALIADRLTADIHYIEDLIGDGDWNLKDGYICRGDVVVGDGTQEHANLEPFLKHEERTGTFSYVFIRCGDDGLTYVDDTPTQAGYQQGHFLRVAGSTLDPNGKSIVGTYMDKKVADILDAYDTYDGEANVAGGMIYCRYDTLKDKNGDVIGAIVVGRSISELRSQVNDTIRRVITLGSLIIIIGSILLFLTMNRWLGALHRATGFLGEIERGDIPDERMHSEGLREVDVLLDGINSLADTLRENEELRIKAETDELTGLANRLGLNVHGPELLNAAIENEECFSLGFLDIDYFKLYNDNYGHQVGDECICRIATVLKDLEEEGKVFAARFGGDEFIIATRCMDQIDVEKFAEKIREKVMDENIPHSFSQVASIVTVSQGHCVGVPEKGESITDFLKLADDVMYDVKSGARNGYRIVRTQDGFNKKEKKHDVPDVIEWRTYHDYLTNLLNREGFYIEAERILRDHPEDEYYIVRTNIRNFKIVNQLYGYEKGNEILVDTAELFISEKIANDVAGRIHGDHFVFLVTKQDFDQDNILEQLRQLSSEIEDTEYVLHYCVGVYPVTDKKMDVSIMCDRANIASASIHSDSDSAIAFYEERMMEDILKENVIIAEFEPALSAGQFKVFLQPLVDTKGELRGAEALVRWFRDDGETPFMPGEFISVLERTGLMYKLDLYVWEEAARILSSWKGTEREDVSVSVNISPVDANYIDILQSLEDLVERYGIDRDKLNLEFTETTLMSDSERYFRIISELREKGFRVEIDDFGSGYSSLNMLKDMNADVLKIDKAFLGEVDNQEKSRDILESIIEMSKKLQMTVVAEGVETEEQVAYLTDMGCDLFQGYYFSRPIRLNEFEEKYFSK